ncbi:unnamed protein product [Phytophthora fragariaefolia]|uniref:Unnamed protein product n=1 Tax=Phytophthora fragariaefolia TaxID=1490495 RepID=A0A9W7CV63_9STRA|nr:unnamed protein product [Phytophthora fragariaefolia]
MTNENISKTNILKLYGAVHIGDPQLYVCEDAVNGDLMTFLSNEENQSLFWLMFLQVAQGLKALHSQGMVHGGLKCTNILVAEGNVVKLSDFGFSFIRGLSIELSNHKNKAMTESVRWKPKEMLQEVSDRNYRFASDVYSLGMCMIEAITQEPPFGFEDDDEITNLIMEGNGHPRPDGVSDAAWGLISALCATEYTERPSLDEAANMIRELAANGAGVGA